MKCREDGTLEQEIPNRLYKYRAFSELTVQMLVSDSIFFASPLNFNDPLDSKPCIDPSLSIGKLEEILKKLHDLRRDNGEETESNPRYRNIRVPSYLNEGSSETVKEAVERAYRDWYVGEIEYELIKRYNKGIFCLSERDDSMLMWSHYGDQHRGICLGYSVSKTVPKDIYRVDYKHKNRLVKSREIEAMLVD